MAKQPLNALDLIRMEYEHPGSPATRTPEIDQMIKDAAAVAHTIDRRIAEQEIRDH